MDIKIIGISSENKKKELNYSPEMQVNFIHYLVWLYLSFLLASGRMERHTKCRFPYGYPESDVKRFEVSDPMIPWSVSFPNYKPVDYTSPKVLQKPVWADPELRYVNENILNCSDQDCTVI